MSGHSNFNKYFKKWRLWYLRTQNPGKTEAIAFHLNNKMSKKPFQYKFPSGHSVKHEPYVLTQSRYLFFIFFFFSGSYRLYSSPGTVPVGITSAEGTRSTQMLSQIGHSFKNHLINVATKVNGSHNNIIKKLTVTDWGPNFLTLKTFTGRITYII